MKAFESQLFTRILPPAELDGDVQLYELTDDLCYYSRMLGRITAHKGMITDFASIPRLAWRYIDPEDPCILYPSVIHDHLYTLKGRLPDGRTYSRKVADHILREAMQACGARADQCFIVFHLVRLFGGSHWS